MITVIWLDIFPFVLACVLRRERVRVWVNDRCNDAWLDRGDVHHRQDNVVRFCACASCADDFEGNLRASRAQLTRIRMNMKAWAANNPDLMRGIAVASSHYSLRWNGAAIAATAASAPGAIGGDIKGTMHHENPRGCVVTPFQQEDNVLARARRRAGLNP